MNIVNGDEIERISDYIVSLVGQDFENIDYHFRELEIIFREEENNDVFLGIHRGMVFRRARNEPVDGGSVPIDPISILYDDFENDEERELFLSQMRNMVKQKLDKRIIENRQRSRVSRLETFIEQVPDEAQADSVEPQLFLDLHIAIPENNAEVLVV